jgi:hypothetical protein
MDNPMFWTVLKADFLFGLLSVAVSVIATVALAAWKIKKQKKAVKEAGHQRSVEPRAIIIGGKNLNPEHCPLCGQGWPLPGPIPETKVLKPDVG